MSGKIIGYIRVSTVDQNLDCQLEGLKLNKVFQDKISGKSITRPAITEMLSYVRDGDTIVVHSMDRLTRNLDDLRLLVKNLTSKQIKVKFVKENLEFTGEDSPMSNLLLSVKSAFAEFERALIKERQMEGIALAKRKGLHPLLIGVRYRSNGKLHPIACKPLCLSVSNVSPTSISAR